jgi:hypothetical protein
MLRLPQVTLCCVDGKNHALALRALDHSRRDIQFARTLFLTDAIPPGVAVGHDVEVVTIEPIRSHREYSHVVMKGLSPYIDTSHVLLVQWDGYVAHPEAWDDAFLRCDYIGAPWPDGSVGNGGFSLRSRRLLEILEDDSFPLVSASEDVAICGLHRRRLQSEYGVVFAETELARRFSFERDASYVFAGERPFGFHGVFHIFLVTDPTELLSLIKTFPESIACSDMTELLLRNLLKFGHYEAALALGNRILEYRRDSVIARGAVAEAGNVLAVCRDRNYKSQDGFVQRIARRLRHVR